MPQYLEPPEAPEGTDPSSTLLRLAETIAGHTRLDTLLPVILELTSKALPCHSCLLSLWDDSRACFVPAATYGLPPSLDNLFHRLPIAPGDIPLIDEVVRRRQPVTADLDDPLVPQALRRFFPPLPDDETESTVQMILGVPLLHHKRVIGGMLVISDRARFGSREVTLITGIARQTALAVASTHAFEIEHRRRRDLETLQETIALLTTELELKNLFHSIVERAALVFSAPAAALFLWDEIQESLPPVATYGLSAKYTRQQRLPTDFLRNLLHTQTDLPPFVISDLRLSPLGDPELIKTERLRTAMVIPLQRGTSLLGLIEVYERAEFTSFDSNSLSLAHALAHQIVIALDNALLYRQAQNRSRQLAEVLAVGYEVRVNQDTAAILQRIAEGVKQGLGWQTVLITRYDRASGLAQGVASAGFPENILDQLYRATPLERQRTLYEREQFRISHSYFVPAERGGTIIARESNLGATSVSDLSNAAPLFAPPAVSITYPTVPAIADRTARQRAADHKDDPVASQVRPSTSGERWQPFDFLIIPIQNRHGEILGTISVNTPNHGRRPDLAEVQALEIFADQAAIALENAQLYSDLRTERERLRALSTRLTQAQEAERARIARELHDEAGQALTTVRLQLDFVASALPPDLPSNIRRQIDEAQALLGRSLEEIRRISIDLRPSLLDDLGLTPALRWQCDRLSHHARLKMHFESTQDVRRLSPDIETAVYRAAQEALTNIVRHAQATSVEVLLDCQDDLLHLTITDDGIGFPDKAGQEMGLGLMGMQERLSAVGGTLRIDSQPGAGSTLYIQVPL